MSASNQNEIKVQVLRGLFCVLLVATVLTVYEVYLFYTNVVPTVQSALDGGISDVAHQLDRYVSTKDICPVKKQFSSVYKTLQDQENVYVSSVNDYTKASAAFLLLLLVGALIAIRYVVVYYRPTEGLQAYTWSVGIWTIALIMAFQWGFYHYGRTYKYLGAFGKDELTYYLSTRL